VAVLLGGMGSDLPGVDLAYAAMLRRRSYLSRSNVKAGRDDQPRIQGRMLHPDGFGPHAALDQLLGNTRKQEKRV
jgi:hypothetical protein